MNPTTTQTDLSLIRSWRQKSDWQGATQTRRRRFRRMISLSHHITFMLGKRFPQSVPLIFVLGYPKSGTSWVCQLIADYMQLPFPQHSILPIGCAAVVHGHETVTAKYPIGVYVMRDGRDVMVSAFNHLRNHAKAGGKSRWNTDFFRFAQLDSPVDNYAALPRFIEYSATHPFGAHRNWADHVKSFYAAKNHHFGLVRYEDLVADTVAALSTTISQLSVDEVDAGQIVQTANRFSFERLAGRASGKEDQMSYLRKGTAGDWQNCFNQESAEVFQKYFGDALVQAGYESTTEWINACKHEGQM